MKKLLIILIVVFNPFIAYTLFSQRQQYSLNENWQFIESENIDFQKIESHNTTWERINIPHTWNLDAYETKNYKRRSCWYQKELSIPDSQKDKALYLKFEAINSSAEVYLNGKLLKTHKGGYGAFTVDITDHISYGNDNPDIISVKVNNENSNIPPLSGDFTIFGGIYRDVWLISTSKQHFSLSDFASEGVYIKTPLVSEKEAQVVVTGNISSIGKYTSDLKIHAQILDDKSQIVLKQEIKLNNTVNSSIPFEIKDFKLSNPHLWSPDNPYLYTMQVVLIGANDQVKDKVSIPFGLRWFSVDTDKGFIINGKPLKLMGVCRHQDQSPLGIAVPNEVHRRDMQMIKNMGANFVRLAHYQHDDAILDECDRLGLLVWEEIPVVDIISLSDDFTQNATTALQEMVRQHYNHPSVIMWGHMNEAVIQVQYRIKKEEQAKFYQKTVELAHKLEKTLKQEDPSRLSVMAYHGNQIYNDISLAGITDVSGWNLYQGWYENDFNAFNRFVDNENKKYPRRPLIISEFGAGSDKRIQSLHPQIFDFSMQWQQLYLEHYLPAIMERPFIIGASEWNFIDFSSASRQESMPHINNKGLVYSDRTPKDVFYYFQSFLRKDIPVLHIAVEDWKQRTLVSDSKNTIQPVKVYSNLQNVTLNINGETLETKDIQNCNAIWQTPLKEGVNNIHASGSYNGRLIEKHTEISVSFVPEHITTQNVNGLELAVNAGSNCYFTDDKSGLCWLPDKAYSEGSWGYIGGSVFSRNGDRIGTTSDIKGTYNTPLFQTKRQNPESYRFDVPDGWYEVQLSFADITNSLSKEAYDLGTKNLRSFEENTFSIHINGQTVAPNFSPFLESGNNFAIIKNYIIEVTNGHIAIDFQTLKGKSFVNALKIRKL